MKSDKMYKKEKVTTENNIQDSNQQDDIYLSIPVSAQKLEDKKMRRRWEGVKWFNILGVVRNVKFFL